MKHYYSILLAFLWINYYFSTWTDDQHYKSQLIPVAVFEWINSQLPCNIKWPHSPCFFSHSASFGRELIFIYTSYSDSDSISRISFNQWSFSEAILFALKEIKKQLHNSSLGLPEQKPGYN